MTDIEKFKNELCKLYFESNKMYLTTHGDEWWIRTRIFRDLMDVIDAVSESRDEGIFYEEDYEIISVKRIDKNKNKKIKENK